jgi:hypothetical protein
MKKIIYSILFAITVSTTFYSCTEEEVIPKTELRSGGSPLDPKTK